MAHQVGKIFMNYQVRQNFSDFLTKGIFIPGIGLNLRNFNIQDFLDSRNINLIVIFFGSTDGDLFVIEDILTKIRSILNQNLSFDLPQKSLFNAFHFQNFSNQWESE